VKSKLSKVKKKELIRKNNVINYFLKWEFSLWNMLEVSEGGKVNEYLKIFEWILILKEIRVRSSKIY